MNGPLTVLVVVILTALLVLGWVEIDRRYGDRFDAWWRRHGRF